MSEPAAFDFQPLDPRIRRDPYAHYARGRREFPLYAQPGPLRLFSLFRYDDCQAVLRDAETWSNVFPSDLRPGGENRPQVLNQEPPPSMLGTDGAEHARLRGLVNKAFTPRIVQRLEPRVKQVADELVRGAVAQGEVDLVQALTYPLPVTIIAEIIGVPAEDRAQFKEWSDEAVSVLGTGFFGALDPETIRRQTALRQAMDAYFVPLAEERRRQPQEDLLTGLVQAEYEGSRLSHGEMLSMLTLLLVAGNETTTTLIGNAVLTLLEHPDQLARLRADTGLLPTAIEETLRFSSPIQFDPRRCTRPLELLGQELQQDDIVLCWLGSANRDEKVFEDPDRFDVGRPKTAHLAFGFGAHYCLGANLARLEAQIALETLLRHTRSIEAAGTEPPPLHPSPVFRSFTSVPVRLAPA
ncbi:MAG: cytochrome P450 [Proteobacteria bacterium]|nr:cytochrome P450 [Pseudomonadota bacterium]